MQQLFDACAAKRRLRRRDGFSNMRADIVALLYGLAGLVFIAIGIPLALERVPPNHWYGFRTAKTFSNQTIWYASNRVADIDLMIAGVVVALGVLATFILHETVLPTLSIARWGFGLFIVAMTIVVLHGFRFLSRV
jgi:uncharacterized membrane protein